MARVAARARPAVRGGVDRAPVDVTDGRFADTDPVFTGDGLYLAFLSLRSFDPVYDAQSFDMSFPFGSRPYLVPLAAATPSPFGPVPGGRELSTEPPDEDGAAAGPTGVDADGLPERVVPIPVVEARYFGLQAIKGGLAWRRAPGERRARRERRRAGRRPAAPGAGAVRPAPSARSPNWPTNSTGSPSAATAPGWSSTTTASCGSCRPAGKPRRRRARPSRSTCPGPGSPADPAALWRHAYAEAGRIMRRDFWVPDMSGVDWDGVLDDYRPLLDRIRGAADVRRPAVGGARRDWVRRTRTCAAAEDDAPDAAGGRAARRRPVPGRRPGAGVVDRVLPGESSDPRARSPLAAPGVAVAPGGRAGGGGRAAGRSGARPVAAAGRRGRPAGGADRAAGVRRAAPGRRRAAAQRAAAALPGLGGRAAPRPSASSARDALATCTSRT